MAGYIAVDLDGTLAEYVGFRTDGSIGPPVPQMLARVKQWLAEGREVRIVTARVAPMLEGATVSRLGTIEAGILEQQHLIEDWCLEHVGQILTVQCYKCYGMICLYDDRAVRVEVNTGRLLSPEF